MRRARSSSCALLLSLSLLAGSIAEATEVEPGIYRLEGLDVSLPNDDLEPLAKIIGKADVVALGEAVHTSGGFYKAKYRLFTYMVEELGFRVMGFESPWIRAEEVAEYVQSCTGSAKKAVEGLFGVWQSVAVRDLANWMCQWNQENPDDRVYFYGFDIQQGHSPYRLRARLRSFGVAEDDPMLEHLFDCVRPRSQGLHDGCIQALDEIEAFLDQNEEHIVETTSEEDLAWARIHLVATRAYEDQQWYWGVDMRKSLEARDAGMAYVAEHIRRVRFPKAKTALWAHNYHIGRGRILGDKVMGLHLKQAFKRKYKAIGLIALEADTDWPGIGCGHFATAEEGSVEELLSRLGQPFLLVDLSFPGGDPAYLKPGRRFDFNWGWSVIPKQRYNGLVYLEKSEKMEPLAWRACRP